MKPSQVDLVMSSRGGGHRASLFKIEGFPSKFTSSVAIFIGPVQGASHPLCPWDKQAAISAAGEARARSCSPAQSGRSAMALLIFKKKKERTPCILQVTA
jgi:hypothetical protein